MKAIFSFLVLLAGVAGAQTGPYEQLPGYDFGKDAAPVTAITQEVSGTAPAGYPAIEAKLLAVLQNPAATYAAKKFVCEQLRVVGSQASIAPLVKLLDAEDTAGLARLALDVLPGAAVDDHLLQALSRQTGKSRIGLIQTLAVRRCEKAVSPLRAFLAAPDAGLAAAALEALGKISGAQAIAALQTAGVAPGLEPVRQRALMDAAYALVERGQPAAAEPLFDEQFRTGTSLPAVIAAMNGLAACRGEQALPVTLGALKDSRQELALAAAQALQRIDGNAVTQALCGALPGLPPAVQAAVVRTLALRGDKAACAAVRALLASPEEAVRAEAALALEKLGDSTVVPDLIAMAAGQGEPAAAAQQSLGRINAAGVNEAMATMLDDPDPQKVRMAALTLKARADRSVMPRLLAMAGADKVEVRNAALEALDGFAGTAELPALLGMLSAAKDRDKVVSAVWKATTALGTEEQRFVELWGNGSRHPEALIALASVAGGAKPLQIATQAASSGDAALREAAARALFAWKTDAAIAPIVEIVRTTGEPKLKILGARAAARLVTDRKCSWKQSRKLETLEQLLPLMSRPEDKKMLENAIANVKLGAK